MTTTVALPARQRTLAALTALALVLAAFVAGTATARPAGAATSAEKYLAGKINAARSAQGVHRLTVRADLAAVARGQAARMAGSNRLYHNPDLTRQVHNWRWVGENVGYAPDVVTVHVAFMQSPAHKANIVDRDYTEVGVGVVSKGGRVWVAEVFRKPLRATTAKSSHPTLRYGSRGTAVKLVQKRLGVRQTGWFGPVTRGKVKAFQHRKGLRRTGVVDARTWRALGL